MNKQKKLKIGFIGGGNMGEAIIAGVCRRFSVGVCEKRRPRARQLKIRYGVRIESLDALARWADVIVLAVKPQDLGGVLDVLKPLLAARHLVVSIAAGVTTGYIEKRIGSKPRVVRTMPNMSVMIAEGITAIAAGQYALKKDVETVKQIFENIGQTIVVRESGMDAVTAISGSGPAYVFLIIEYLIRAARKLGLSHSQAKQLVIKTFSGSSRLVDDRKADPAAMRKKVTSKGGTTQAALKEFEKGNLARLIERAARAAARRSQQLSR